MTPTVLILDADGSEVDWHVGYGPPPEKYLESQRFLFGSKKRDISPLKEFIKKYPESALVQSAYSYLSSYYQFSGTKEEATKFFEEYIAFLILYLGCPESGLPQA